MKSSIVLCYNINKLTYLINGICRVRKLLQEIHYLVLKENINYKKI